MNTTEYTFIDYEQIHMFNCYCTMVMLLHGKHMNYINVFVTTLKNKFLLRSLRLMLGVDSNYEAIQFFLQQAPSIIKSKHVMKCINQLNKLKQLDVVEF